MKFEIIGKSDKGLKRQNNEDAFKIIENIGVAIVADGMGGHAAGDVASAIAVNSVKDNLLKIYESQKGIIYRKDLRNALRAAHENIISSIENNPSQLGMGTTAVVISCRKSFISFAHIGDSRLYRWRNNKLKQITVDHSLVQEYDADNVDSSKIGKNIITRALGQKGGLKPETNRLKILENDLFILCSDGLSSMLTDTQIAYVLTKFKNIEEKVDGLINAALKAGGDDNVTVVIAQISQISDADLIDDTKEENYPPDNSYEPTDKIQEIKNKKNLKNLIPFVAILVVFFIALFFFNTKINENKKKKFIDATNNLAELKQYFYKRSSYIKIKKGNDFYKAINIKISDAENEADKHNYKKVLMLCNEIKTNLMIIKK